ncbi:hypothetical protein J6590_077975, partial [Homalodisca vitripennis]
EPDWYFPWSRGTLPCWSPACYLSYNKVAPFPSPSNLKEEEVLIKALESVTLTRASGDGTAPDRDGFVCQLVPRHN